MLFAACGLLGMMAYLMRRERSDVNERKPLTSPTTGMSLSRREQPGYYPGFSTLNQKTTGTQPRAKSSRTEYQQSIRFFTSEEALTMQAVIDRILPQDDRTKTRIPILPWIDQRLYQNRIEGYRYEDMPSDQEAYRIATLLSRRCPRRCMAALSMNSGREQEKILNSIHQANPSAAQELWKQMNIKRFWAMLVSDVVRSTSRILGRGTRLASVALPIRAATCASKRARRSHGR